MIEPQCFTTEWLARQRGTYPNVSDATLEKSIRAMALLERLAESGLPFVFKGGTCMLLHIPVPRRLSVDIDIVCTKPIESITPIFDAIGAQKPFTRWDEDARNPDRRPKRKHFRFYYDSIDPNNPEPFVLLDIVLESVPQPHTESKPVVVPFVVSARPPHVTVPTINGLLGDKLTAFAPETVGVRYSPRLAQQIIKQMFDVGELFLLADNVRHIRESHAAIAAAESGFRRSNFSQKQTLKDTLRTALRVSALQLERERHHTGKKRGILLAGIAAINVTLVRDIYTVETARVSASRAALLAAILISETDVDLASLRFTAADLNNLPRQLTHERSMLTPLRSTATEAFHNWHQVQRISAGR